MARKVREISGFNPFACCPMGNPVHLSLQTAKEPLEQAMRRTGMRHAVWYNSKYERAGHLFQDRYKSEAVKDEVYFVTVLRYILNNPVKAGICGKASDYSRHRVPRDRRTAKSADRQRNPLVLCESIEHKRAVPMCFEAMAERQEEKRLCKRFFPGSGLTAGR